MIQRTGENITQNKLTNTANNNNKTYCTEYIYRYINEKV